MRSAVIPKRKPNNPKLVPTLLLETFARKGLIAFDLVNHQAII